MSRRGRIIGSMLRSRSREEKARLVERFRTEVLPGFEHGSAAGRDRLGLPGGSRRAKRFSRMRENGNIGKILLDWSAVGGSA